MTDRHRPGYYKEYYARSEKAKAKSKAQAAQQKAARHANLLTCSICGNPRYRSSAIGDRLGIHQRCDPAAWMAEVRKQK